MPLATPDPRRRLFVQGAMLGTLRLVAAFNVILLVAICLFLLVQGLPALSWEFLSTPPREMMTDGLPEISARRRSERRQTSVISAAIINILTLTRTRLGHSA